MSSVIDQFRSIVGVSIGYLWGCLYFLAVSGSNDNCDKRKRTMTSCCFHVDDVQICFLGLLGFTLVYISHVLLMDDLQIGDSWCVAVGQFHDMRAE